MISSTTNPRIVRARRLHKRRERERRGVVLLEGRPAVEAALDAGSVQELYVLGTPPPSVERARAAGASTHQVTRAVMEHLTAPGAAPGVLAIAKLPAEAAPAHGPNALLFGVRDPATLGAILATLEAVGGGGAILGPGTTDPWAPRAIRAAAGSPYRMPLMRHAGTAEDVLAMERSRGARLIGLADTGPAPWEVDLGGELALVVGVPTEQHVAVPAARGRASLAVRAAVVLYEWVRQSGDAR